MSSSISVAIGLAAAALAAVPAFAEATSAASGLTPAGPAVVRALLDASGSPQPLCSTAPGRAVWQAVQAFYRERADRPAWVEDGRLTAAGARLVQVLRDTEDEGLDPRRYEPALLAPSANPTAANVEVGLTAAFGLYASDLARGHVDPSRVSVLWRFEPAALDLAPLLREAAATGHPEKVFERVRPSNPQYAALRRAWRRYATLAQHEAGVPLLAATPTLRPGARRPEVRALRARLAFWGDLGQTRAATGPSDVYDAALVQAVKAFQARHGLEPDGVVSPEVVAALDTPVRDQLRQISLNLERWRWQTRPAGRRCVLVNVPTFELHAYDGTREALTMRVVTGKPDTPTPVFTEPMTDVVFSPYWNVPTNIALDETMPKVRRDPSYARKMNLEVLRGDEVVDPAKVDWRREASRVSFRQRPGSGNALGLVKFLLPNPFNVYLHDTPEAALFLRSQRTLSHGCVRLQKPQALAEWVLGGSADWTRTRIVAAMHGGTERAVPVPDPVTVSIVYFTVWVDADGEVQFRPDVYRHDAAQVALLDRPAPSAGEAPVAVAAAPAATLALSPEP